MFELVQSSSVRRLVVEQAPTLAISLVIAELFYKFGSFSLECLAFLGTWFVIDGLWQGAMHLIERTGDSG